MALHEAKNPRPFMKRAHSMLFNLADSAVNEHMRNGFFMDHDCIYRQKINSVWKQEVRALVVAHYYLLLKRSIKNGSKNHQHE